MDDNAIIEMFFARSENAISALSAKYGGMCRSISENILKNKEDAEECVNDTYLRVWQSIPPTRPKCLSAYIGKIARNKALSKYRKNTALFRNSRFDASLDELADCISSVGTVEEEFDAARTAEMINLFLGTLDSESRVIFLMRYWAGYSVKAIAKSFDAAPNTVTVRISRIKEKLRKYLQKEGTEI